MSITTRASSGSPPDADRSESRDTSRGPRASSAPSTRRAQAHREPARLRARVRGELREHGRADRQVAHAARHLGIARAARARERLREPRRQARVDELRIVGVLEIEAADRVHERVGGVAAERAVALDSTVAAPAADAASAAAIPAGPPPTTATSQCAARVNRAGPRRAARGTRRARPAATRRADARACSRRGPRAARARAPLPGDAGTDGTPNPSSTGAPKNVREPRAELARVGEEERAQLAAERAPRERAVQPARRVAREVHRGGAVLDLAAADRAPPLLLELGEQRAEVVDARRRHLEPEQRHARAEDPAVAALRPQVHGQRHDIARGHVAAPAHHGVVGADRDAEIEDHRREEARERARALRGSARCRRARSGCASISRSWRAPRSGPAGERTGRRPSPFIQRCHSIAMLPRSARPLGQRDVGRRARAVGRGDRVGRARARAALLEELEEALAAPAVEQHVQPGEREIGAAVGITHRVRAQAGPRGRRGAAR